MTFWQNLESFNLNIVKLCRIWLPTGRNSGRHHHAHEKQGHDVPLS